MARQGAIRGRAAALAACATTPPNAGRHASWRSIRGGVSADGTAWLHPGLSRHRRRRSGAARTAATSLIGCAAAGRLASRRLSARLSRPADEALDARCSRRRCPAALARRRSGASAPSTAGASIAAEQAFSDRAQQVGIRRLPGIWPARRDPHLLGAGFAVGLAAIGAAQAVQRGADRPRHGQLERRQQRSPPQRRPRRHDRHDPQQRPAPRRPARALPLLHDLAPRQPGSALALHRGIVRRRRPSARSRRRSSGRCRPPSRCGPCRRS